MTLFWCIVVLFLGGINVDSWHCPDPLPDRWGWLRGLLLTVALIAASGIAALLTFVGPMF